MFRRLTLGIVLTAGLAVVILVFLVSTNACATSFARQADCSIASISDQIGLAMNDLPALKEETRQFLSEESKLAVERLDRVHAEARQMVKTAQDEMHEHYPTHASLTPRLRAMQRIAHLASRNLSEEERFEVLEYESALAGADLIAAPRLGSVLSQIYLALGRFYLGADFMRARFY